MQSEEPAFPESCLIGNNDPFELADLLPENGGYGSVGTVVFGTFHNENLGYSGSHAGDVNNDGIDDVILGTGDDVGAYVVFGSSTGFGAELDLTQLDGTNGFRLLNLATGRGGIEVSSAGDINADGVHDIMLGSLNTDRAFVVFGRDGDFPAVVDLNLLDGTTGFALGNFSMGSQRYRAVSSAGDFNGDGYDDMLLGAAFANGTGEAHVIFGRDTAANPFPALMNIATLGASDGFTIRGAGGRFGEAVESGDINDDGFSDVVIGAFNEANGTGAAYVIYGSGTPPTSTIEVSDLDGNNGFRIVGQPGQVLGVALAVGDANGDQVDDLILGAHGQRNHSESPGSTYVLFGQVSGFPAEIGAGFFDGQSGFIIKGEASNDFSGNKVGAADVNDDGIDDILIGALEADPNGEQSGKSYVVLGRMTPIGSVLQLSEIGFGLNGVDPGDRSGAEITSVGDINSDGAEDFLIGAWRANQGNLALAGEAYLLYGCLSNEAPVPQPDAIQIHEDSGPIILDVLVNNGSGPDVDPDDNLIPDPVALTSPLHGELVDSGSTFTYTPDEDFFGTDHFTYEVCDTGGLCATAEVTIDVLAVNDAPSFSPGSDQEGDEDAGDKTIDWATDISPGPKNELHQEVEFIVSNNNNLLFQEQPSISSDGVLTYRSADDAHGQAIVTVILRDNGGTDRNGENQSEAVTFVITVNSVIDAIIDVKPGNGDEVDPVNLKANGRLPIAILTTQVCAGEADDFDATLLDTSTIKLNAVAIIPEHLSFEDVDGDGDIDLLLHFSMRDLRDLGILHAESVDIVLTAEVLGGEALGDDLVGLDAIRIVPRKKDRK